MPIVSISMKKVLAVLSMSSEEHYLHGYRGHFHFIIVTLIITVYKLKKKHNFLFNSAKLLYLLTLFCFYPRKINKVCSFIKLNDKLTCWVHQTWLLLVLLLVDVKLLRLISIMKYSHMIL